MKCGALRVVLLAFASASVMGWSAGVQAQPYPSKPVRFMVGYPPGGSSDVSARVIGPKLAERLGQPVIIDNRAGAGGIIGVETVAKSAADGYTIGFGPMGMLAVNATLHPNLPYDPLKDLAPITLSMILPQIVVANAAIPVNSIQELIAYAKTRPGQLGYGTAGNGTAPHMAGAMLALMAGIDLFHVPYKGGHAAATDLIGGQIPFAVIDLASAKSFARVGRIRELAVTSARRTSLAPEIPTVAESGLPGFEMPSWFGIIAPAGTPAAIIARLNADLVAVLKSPDVHEKMTSAGVEPISSTPEEFAVFLRKEIQKYAQLIKSAGIKSH